VETADPTVSAASTGITLTGQRVSVPVKKFKNKKVLQKVRRLRDFCLNVNSYIETIMFKLQVREIQLSGGSQEKIEVLVSQMLAEDTAENGKPLKITSLKVIYLHLRENRLQPKCKCYYILISYSATALAKTTCGEDTHQAPIDGGGAH
jgi:hypothetical protein